MARKQLINISLHGIAILSLIQFVACTSPKQAVPLVDPNAQLTTDTNYTDTYTSSYSDMDNLFNTQTTEEETSDGNDSIEDVSSTENDCLTNDWAWGLGGTTQNSACFSQSSSGLNYNSLYGMSVNSYRSMDRCLQIALSAAPKAGATESEVQLAFVVARMAMVRCFRQITQWQQSYYPWSANQTQAYGYADNNLWMMLYSLQQTN